MPIKPLTVLPQLKPVTYQDPAQNNQSFRILEEIMQQQGANERARQAGLLATEKAYGDLLASDETLPNNPYQERELGAVDEEKRAYAEKIKNTYDPVERMALINQARSSLFNKPGYSSALLEQASAERFHEIAKANAESVDPEYYNSVMAEYYREDRNTPMRPQDFNPGRLLKSPEKAADDYIKSSHMIEKDTEEWDSFHNQVIVRKKTELSDEKTFKDDLADYMARNTAIYGKYGDQERIDFINRKWEDAKRKSSGTVTKILHGFEDDPTAKAKLDAAAKKESADGFDEALQRGGKSYKDPTGTLIISTDKDGTIHVWDNKEGVEIASGDMGKVWGSLTPYLQNKAKELGLEPSYDLSIGGTGYKKGEIIRDGEDVVSDGLSKEDAPLAGKSTTTIKDNTLTTNDPGVLKKAGYTVGYDDKKNKYYITRVVDGLRETIYEYDPKDNKNKTLVTDGGSGKGTAKTFTVKLDKPYDPDAQGGGKPKDTRTGVEMKEGAVGSYVPKMEPQRLDTFKKDVISMYQSGAQNTIVKKSENAAQDSLSTDIEGAKGIYQFYGEHKDNFLKSIGESDWDKAYEKLGKEEFDKKQEEYFNKEIRDKSLQYTGQAFKKAGFEKSWHDWHYTSKGYRALYDGVNDYIASTANQSGDYQKIIDKAVNRFVDLAESDDHVKNAKNFLKLLYEARVEYIMGLPEDVKKKSKYYRQGKWEEIGINRPYQDYVAALGMIDDYVAARDESKNEQPYTPQQEPTQVQAPPPPPANNNAPALKPKNANVLKAKKLNIQ